MIEEDGGLVMDEEPGCCSCSACRRPIGPVRGFGVFEGGPTLEEDAQRDLQDRVVGMESPLLVAGHQELDEHDDALSPRPYQTAFVEVLRIEKERMAVGQAVGEEGTDSLGSFMSPDSVLRMLSNLPPKDIFSRPSRPLVLRLRIRLPEESVIEQETGATPQRLGVPA
jgi:hypothetical protein